jgi:LysM repeat protein
MTSRLKSKERSRENPSVSPVRQQQQQQQQLFFIELSVNPNETLQSISMKFGTTVADLKRINSLLNERDMYALKFIKVPIKPHSILAQKYANQLKQAEANLSRLNTIGRVNLNTEIETLEDTSNINSDDEVKSIENETTNLTDCNLAGGVSIAQTNFITKENEQDDDINAPLLQSHIHISEESGTTVNKPKTAQTKEAKRYLKRLDNKLENLKSQNNELYSKAVKQLPESMSISDELIPISNISYLVESRESKNATGLIGALNMNTWQVLIIACIIVVLIPLAIIAYNFIYYNDHKP